MSNPITPLTPSQETAEEQQASHESYVTRDLVAVDQMANVVTGGLPDETISSRMARWDTEDTGIKHEIGHIMSAGLDVFQKDHGAGAEAGDLERAEVVATTEDATGTLPTK